MHDILSKSIQQKQKTYALTFLVRVMFSVLLLPCFCPGQALSNENTFLEGDIKEILRLAESGDAEAQFSYALLLDEGGRIDMDKRAAIYWFHRAAEQGLPAACFYLGIKYEFGSTVERDRVLAIHWYEKAAVQGWPGAQFHLGRVLLEGNGEAGADPVQAVAWLHLAEEGGYPGAKEEKEKAVMSLTEIERTRAKKLETGLRKQIEYTAD